MRDERVVGEAGERVMRTGRVETATIEEPIGGRAERSGGGVGRPGGVPTFGLVVDYRRRNPEGVIAARHKSGR
jgi:hypothetical protein